MKGDTDNAAESRGASRLANYYNSKGAHAPEVINSDILAIINQLKEAESRLKLQTIEIKQSYDAINSLKLQRDALNRNITDAEDDAASERARSAELEEEMEHYKSELLTLAATIMAVSINDKSAKSAYIKSAFAIAHEAREIIKRVFPDGVNLS